MHCCLRFLNCSSTETNRSTMAKYCYNCGGELAGNEKFCGQCGARQEPGTAAGESLHPGDSPAVKNETREELQSNDPGVPEKKTSLPRQEFDYRLINKNLKVKNNQRSIVRGAMWITVPALVAMALTTMESSPLFKMHALPFIAGFVALSGLVTAWIFRLRAKKLATLISGENVVAGWQLSEKQKSAYANYLFSDDWS